MRGLSLLKFMDFQSESNFLWLSNLHLIVSFSLTSITNPVGFIFQLSDVPVNCHYCCCQTSNRLSQGSVKLSFVDAQSLCSCHHRNVDGHCVITSPQLKTILTKQFWGGLVFEILVHSRTALLLRTETILRAGKVRSLFQEVIVASPVAQFQQHRYQMRDMNQSVKAQLFGHYKIEYFLEKIPNTENASFKKH